MTGWVRALFLVGGLLCATMVFHLAALMVTNGPWNGPLSLRKPATFAETGWLICWAVALILPPLRTSAWQRHVIGATSVLFAVGEMAIIGLEAWRGVPSYYNFATPFDAALMRGGAAGTAFLFLGGVVVMLAAALRSWCWASARLAWPLPTRRSRPRWLRRTRPPTPPGRAA